MLPAGRRTGRPVHISHKQKKKKNHKRFWLDHHPASQSNYIYTMANIKFCIQLRKKMSHIKVFLTISGQGLDPYAKAVLQFTFIHHLSHPNTALFYL